MPQAPKLLDHVRERIRFAHSSLRTADSYVQWIWRFNSSRCKRLPSEMGTPQIDAFLARLPFEGNGTAWTRNPAHSVLPFLYMEGPVFPPVA
jgi:hypothetical protein